MMPGADQRPFDTYPAAWHAVLRACLEAPAERRHQIERWYQTDATQGDNYRQARYLCKRLRGFFKAAHDAGRVPPAVRLVTRIRQHPGEAWLVVSIAWVPWGADREARKSSDICEEILQNLASSPAISIDSSDSPG